MFILAVSGLCRCVCFSVVVESGGYCLFQWGGFLVAVASSVADTGLQSAVGSVVEVLGFIAQSQLLWFMGLAALWQVGSSWTRD